MATSQVTPPDFIPDAHFVPDQSAPSSGNNDFIPDSEFVPDSVEAAPEPSHETSLTDKLKTFAEHAAQGPTVGISTKLETMPVPESGSLTHALMSAVPGLLEAKQVMGQVNPQDIQARTENNPLSAFTGDLAGGVAFGAMSPIAGAAKAAIPNIAGRVLGDVTEGAILGGSNAVNDYFLGDPNLNAQKILSDIGMGAALGGIFGALAKGAKPALPVATSAVKSGLGKLGDLVGSAAEKLPGEWGEKLRLGFKNSEDPQKYARQFIDNIGDLHKSSYQAADEMYNNVLKPNLKAVLSDVPFQKVSDASYSTLRDAQDLVEKMRADKETFAPAQVKQFSKAVEDLQIKFDSAETPYDLHEALHDFAKDSSKAVRYDKLPTFAQQAVRGSIAATNDSVRMFLKNPEVWGKDAANQFSQVSDLYNSMKTARQNLERDLMTKEYTPSGMLKATPSPSKISRFFNNAGDVSQDLITKHLDDYMKSLQDSVDLVKNHAEYKNAESILSQQVNQLAKTHNELSDVAKVLSQRIKGYPGAMEEFLLGTAAHAAGVIDPILGSALAGIEGYKAVIDPFKLGSQFSKAYNVFKAVGSMADRSSKAIASGIKNIYSGSARTAIPNAVGKQEYDNRIQRINELNSDPQAMLNHLEKSTAAMYDAAPNISQGIHDSMTRAVSFLQSKVPKPPMNYAIPQDWSPNEVQKQQFNRYYNVVNDPISVLHDISNGTLLNTQIEALQAVYPHLLVELKSQIATTLSSPKAKDAPYSVKLAIAKFLGMPVDANTTPQALAANQQVFVPTPPPGQGGGPKGKPRSTLGGLKELDVAQRARTQSQVLEGQEDD